MSRNAASLHDSQFKDKTQSKTLIDWSLGLGIPFAIALFGLVAFILRYVHGYSDVLTPRNENFDLKKTLANARKRKGLGHF
jgi:hypothetical protein